MDHVATLTELITKINQLNIKLLEDFTITDRQFGQLRSAVKSLHYLRVELIELKKEAASQK